MVERSTMTRWLSAAGALLAGASVALSAYASHGADAGAREWLMLAAAFGFGHGLALVALAPLSRGKLGASALLSLLLGTVLFSGALVAKAAWDASATTAPFGGMLLIAGWVLQAIATARR